MKRFIPSFRLQIILLFLTLLVLSVLFTRIFFLKSNQSFLEQISLQTLDTGLDSLYQIHSVELPEESRVEFKHRIETMMVDAKQIELATDFYRQQVQIYSSYIMIFISVAVLMIFLLSLYLVTRPLKRLQNATRALAGGDSNIQVQESHFSPLNGLIISFNQMARELEANKQRAIEAEKQMVWREIARVMAHEIKNPLTPMKLSIERLEYKILQKPESALPVLQETIAIIKEEIQSLQTLVDRFRGFAVLPEAQPESYHLEEQLREICQGYQGQFRLILEIPESLPLIHADRMQLKQVFANLLQNAVDAIGSDNGQVSISAVFGHHQFSITIADNGPGIAPVDLARIFEPYFTTKRKGTGLGLAIVKRIIENHNGRLELDTRPGQGCRVTVILPDGVPH